MTRDNKLTIKLSDVEKQVVEKLSEAYDCSQSAAARMLFSTHWQELFGQIHPEAFDRHDLDIKAAIRGEVDPEQIDDKYRMDTDGKPSVPAADGGLGAAVSPASHTPTQTPIDLSKAGPALSWDELTDAIGKHWSDDLEIHPDRVEPEWLKNNHGMCSKIIAGVLRFEEDVVVEPLIEQRIEDYLGHKVERADYESGLEYRIEQYKPQIIEHLAAHPNVKVDTYYTSPTTQEEQLPSYVEELIDELDSNVATDLDAWLEENSVQPGDMAFEDYDDLLDDLKAFRVALAKLGAIVQHGRFSEILEGRLDYPEEQFDGVAEYLVALLRGMKDEYTNAPEHARYVVANEYVDPDEIYHQEFDETETAAADFNAHENGGGRMPLEKQFSIIARNL